MLEALHPIGRRAAFFRKHARDMREAGSIDVMFPRDDDEQEPLSDAEVRVRLDVLEGELFGKRTG